MAVAAAATGTVAAVGMVMATATWVTVRVVVMAMGTVAVVGMAMATATWVTVRVVVMAMATVAVLWEACGCGGAELVRVPAAVMAMVEVLWEACGCGHDDQVMQLVTTVVLGMVVGKKVSEVTVVEAATGALAVVVMVQQTKKCVEQWPSRQMLSPLRRRSIPPHCGVVAAVDEMLGKADCPQHEMGFVAMTRHRTFRISETAFGHLPAGLLPSSLARQHRARTTASRENLRGDVDYFSLACSVRVLRRLPPSKA